MRILVACEYSGVVREAFRARGHDAWSCDIVPTEQPGPHIVNDVRNILDWDWDMMIAHPPCQYTSDAGARWLTQPGRLEKREAALEFFMLLMNAPIERIALENPYRNYITRAYRKPNQVIEPYHFGHPMTKATGLWLKNLPPLMASLIVCDPDINWTKYKKGSHTGKARAKTFEGVAAAMAAQWGND